MKLIFSIFVVLTIIACKTDLTTQYVKQKEITNSDEQLGRKILVETQKEVNIKQLLNYKNYKVKFNDCFYGFSGKLANPYKINVLLLKPKTFNGQLKFTSGKEEGKIYGIENNQTYELIDHHQVFKKDKRTKFWLPTYQYFIEFPLRILEADRITYAGESSYNNNKYDLGK